MDVRTRVLELLADADAAGVEALAEEADLELGVTLDVLAALRTLGLARLSDADELPVPTDAGRQWLDGYQPADPVLLLLPSFVDDLHARAALLIASRALVNEFAEAIAEGTGVGYARQIVPPAFVPAVDAELAVRLFAALIAVIARLGREQPAACVAEELMAVALIAEATTALEDQAAAQVITDAECEAGRAAMPGVFDLFGDDDVLLLFSMAEPSDAALAGFAPDNQRLGVVDQRVESWFNAFGGEAALGHLA